MFRHNVQFERTEQNCSCNLIPEIKPLFALPRQTVNQYNKQPFSSRKHYQNQHPSDKTQKISIASHKINKQQFGHKRIKSNILAQKPNSDILFLTKQENCFKNQNLRINQMNQCKTVRNMYIRPMITTQQVYTPQYFYVNNLKTPNFHQQLIPKLYRNKTYSSTTNYYPLTITQPVKIQQIQVQNTKHTKDNLNYLSSNNNQTNGKNIQIETQASNYIAPFQKQQSQLQEQQERQPSISENIPKRRQPLTHFRVIESINGLTDQSLDRLSEVLSHGFHRNQVNNANLTYQKDPLILQKLRSSQNNNFKTFEKKRASHGQILSTKF